MSSYNENRNGSKKELVDDIKNKVTIPMYFNRIILPNMSSYYAQYGCDLENNRRTCCPLHDEDTPSFYYREELKSYKCFGCGASGDVITLHQAFTMKETGESVSFDAALDFLKKAFIDNGDISTAKIVANTQVHTDPVVMTYMNSMYARAVNALMSSKKFSADEKKKYLWQLRSLREFGYAGKDEDMRLASTELNICYRDILSA